MVQAEKERLLVVDDAPNTLELIQRNLMAAGYQVFTAPGAAEAIRLLDETRIDLVITDLKMPQVSGLDLARYVRENVKDTEVMMITGYPTIQGAVSAVKLGVQDYITKPFTDGELLSAVQRIVDVLKARRDAKNGGAAPLTIAGFIGESRAMRDVFQATCKAAAARVTVLISGESGTGKELVARAIHYSSPLASAPFVPINCGSIPESLLESELFGHVKGAFTGASEARAGFFQTADGGTIFLDEISDTSLAMQSKLLRVLENGEIYMVGSSRPRTVDVRVVAATNKDLRVLVKNGVFREDLFFRLNVINIVMPPLRERENDVLLLTAHFARKFAEELGRPAPQFTDGALRVLASYAWPGNVRELENVVQRTVVMTDGGVIDVRDLPSSMHFSVGRESGLNRTLAEVEAEHIRNVLASAGGNKTQTAEILGIDRKTLREKLKLYGGEQG
jgi:two-component system response regulator HydG